MTASNAPTLRAVLDAHHYLQTPPECICGWRGPGAKAWLDHREQAVRAAIDPRIREVPFEPSDVGAALDAEAAPSPRAVHEIWCADTEHRACVPADYAVAAAPSEPQGSEALAWMTDAVVEQAMEIAGKAVLQRGGPMIEHHDQFVRDFRQALLDAAPAPSRWPDDERAVEGLARLLGQWHPTDPMLRDFQISEETYDRTLPENQRAMREHARAILARLNDRSAP
jgi:hypothetical protein